MDHYVVSLLHNARFEFANSLNTNPISQSVFAPVIEIDLGEGWIETDCTLEKYIHRNEDDDNTLVECKTEAILPPHASKGDEQQMTVADRVPG